MNRSKWMWSWAAVVAGSAAGVGGCQAIAKLETRTADEIKTGCELPSAGNGRVRVVNVGAVAGNADFCIRASGTSSWGRPVLRDGGDDSLCRSGLQYGQATVGFAVPAGTIDVKMIAAGSTCAAAATSEIDGVQVGDASAGAPVVTLVRWGGGTSTEAIGSFPEYVASGTTLESHYRMINAASGGQAVSFGVSDSTTLPATMSSAISLSPVSPGQTLPAGNAALASIDSSGYAAMPSATFNIVATAADDTTNTALALESTGLGTNSSFYLIGDSGDASNAHPVRFLECDENPKVTAASADGGTSGNLAGDDLKLLASCQLSALKTISVDNINAGLYGADSPFYTSRALALPPKLAERPSDIICVTEVDDQKYRDAVAKAGVDKGTFRYSYMVDTTQDTPPSNSDDVRSPPSVPPCGGIVNPDTVTAAYTCLLSGCATSTDPTTAVLNETTNCATTKCSAQLGKLLHPGTVPSDGANIAADQACLNCIIVTVNDGTTFATSKDECTTVAASQYAFHGQTSAMILSRYPLANTSYYVLPSTSFRRTMLKAQVQLGDQNVDFFCGQLNGATIPVLQYVGNYGTSTHGPNGTAGENGWVDEQTLEAQRAIAWIQSESDKDGLPAIIAGDWDADIGLSDADGGVVLVGTSPTVPPLFDAQYGEGGPFDLAVPPGYQPTCDYCSSDKNVYNKQPETFQLLREYVYKFPRNAALSETLWATTADIPVTGKGDPPPNGLGDIGEYFPHNVVLLRPH